MKSLLKYLKGYKKECVFAPLFKMLEALFELFVPLVIAAIIDTGIANGDRGYIYKMCGLLILLAVIGLTCSITAQFFAAKAAVGFSAILRSRLFAHIQSLSFADADKVGTSTLITRMTSDVNQVQNGVNLVLRLFLRSPFIVFGAMIMAFTIDAKAALIFVVMIILLSIVVFGIMLVSMPLYKKVQQGLDKILGNTRENLTGARVIRAFNKEDDEIRIFADNNNALTKMQKFVGRISGLMNPVTYIIVNVSIVVLIWSGAIRVDNGILSQGALVALVNYMSQILVELIKLANLIISVTKAIACGNRIETVFAMQPDANGEFAGATDSDDISTGGADSDSISTGATDSDVIPVVEFDKVSLTYNDAKEEAISDISFKALAGQTIGIIGGTGSGKSSIVNLIPRFYRATKGMVRINGISVDDYEKDTLRRKIGMVLQKAVLFKGSIRDNIAFGCEGCTDEEIWDALSVAQSKDFVSEKEGQLDYMIEQGGKNLSGGQKQRLSIARAMVRKPEILILDDSSSALDFATDAALRKAIRELPDAPTVFIVSQRATSIQYADLIVVLDDGEIAGMGTHEELLKTCEVYQEIYYSQVERKAM